jgi:hypothetical protein
MTTDDPGLRDHLANIELELQAALAALEALASERPIVRSAADLDALERRAAEAADRVGALVIGRSIQDSVSTPEAQREASALARATSRQMKHQGWRARAVRSTRGEPVRVRVPSFSGKKRGRARRATGIYPQLVALGIADGLTPRLSSDVARMAAVCGSFDEAADLLELRGLSLDTKTVRSIAYRFASRARLVRRSRAVTEGTPAAGRRVAAGTDGGRIRIRRDKRGPKTKKGRTRYSTHWREPKLLVICVLDDQGEMEREISAVIDGTLRGPDAVFALLEHDLRALGVSQADTLVFVADGAPWIWRRVPGLVRRLGIGAERVVLVVDFYHAVEHLGRLAALRKKWNGSERSRWVRRQRKLLLEGKVDEVIAAIDALCRGRASKVMAKGRDYFVRNRAAMAYGTVRERKLPIGSGAVESAIRRVVNLRIKGPGIFWHRDHAESMLMLRAFHKAGRWDALEKAAALQSLPVAA